MTSIERRLKTLKSNLEMAVKTTPSDAPHLMLVLQLKELVDIVAQMRDDKKTASP